jgi:hypothetical protein
MKIHGQKLNQVISEKFWEKVIIQYQCTCKNVTGNIKNMAVINMRHVDMMSH